MHVPPEPSAVAISVATASSVSSPSDSRRNGDDGPLPYSKIEVSSGPLSPPSTGSAPSPISPPPPASNSRKRAVPNKSPDSGAAVDNDDMAERSEYYGSMLLQKEPPAAASVSSDEYDDTSKGLRPRQSPASFFGVQRKWMRSMGVGIAVLALLMLSYSLSRHARYHAVHNGESDDSDSVTTNHRIRHNHKKQGVSATRFAAMQSLVAELEPLREPEVRRSVGGVLNTTLHVNTVRFTNGPISFRTRSYEGSIPGPTLSIKAGDTINIELVNDLLPNEPGPWAMNTMHNPNTTNLHVHGMHVDPTGIADNVFRVVEPGQSALTQIHVPKDHPRGLFHYHPHYHGSVFAQMGGGMVGGLIVEDDDDDTVPEEYRNLKSHLIVLQEFRFSGGMASSAVAVAEASHSHLPMQPKYTSKTIFDARVRKLFPHVHQAQASVELELSEGLENHYAAPDKLPQIADYFTVNGQYIPKIEIQPNENRILRFVNTGGVCALELSVPGCTMQLAATDGIYLSAPRSIRTLVLSPGSRADVVFNCAPNSDAAHEFEPLRPLQSVNNPALNGFVGALTDVYEGVVAFFHVKGPSLDMKPLTRVPVPTPLYGEPNSLLNLSQEDRDLMDPEPFLFEFTMGKPRHVDGFTYKTYLINGEEFEGKSIRDMKLGVVQEWVIINKDEMKGEPTDKNHPFHLHTNAFQIVAMSHGEGVEYEIGDWRDVILVPTPGNVTIRFRPVDFTGLIVAHCHVLGHSDAGMVAAVTITP